MSERFTAAARAAVTTATLMEALDNARRGAA